MINVSCQVFAMPKGTWKVHATDSIRSYGQLDDTCFGKRTRHIRLQAHNCNDRIAYIMTHAVHSSQTSRGKDRQTSMALGGSALGSMTLLDLLWFIKLYFSFMKFTVIYCNDLQWLQAPKEFPGCRRCRNILRHVDSTHQDSLMSAAGSTEAKACGKCLPTFSIICLLQPLLRIRSSHSMVACHQILILGLNMKAWLCHTCVIKVVTMLLFNAHHLLLMQLPFHRCWRDHSMICNAFFNVKESRLDVRLVSL